MGVLQTSSSLDTLLLSFSVQRVHWVRTGKDSSVKPPVTDRNWTHLSPLPYSCLPSEVRVLFY